MTFLLTLEADLSPGSIRTLSAEMPKQIAVIALDPTGLAVAREMVQSSTLVANNPAALVRSSTTSTTAISASTVTGKVTAVVVAVVVVIATESTAVVNVVVAAVVVAESSIPEIVASGTRRSAELVTRWGSIEARWVPAVACHMSKHAAVVAASSSSSGVPRHPDRRAIRLNMSNSAAGVALLGIGGTGHGAQVRLVA